MAILYVKKDGSGNSTSIQGAVPLASSGDTIIVEAGTFEENIDLYKDGITIEGADKSQTFIVGQQQTTVTKTGCSWVLGATTVSVPAGTSGLRAGHIVTSSGIPANARIVTVGETSFTISAATTASRSNVSVSMAGIDAAVRWRGNGNALKKLKVQAIQALATRFNVESGAVYFRSAGLGATAANNYLLQDCEIEARGDLAILCDNTGPGGGTVTGCVINGKTFVGELPAQVHTFTNLALSCAVLTSTTIELPSAEYLPDVKVGSTILALTGFIQSATTVSAINGLVLTLSKPVLAFVGTTQTVTFNNIQFNIPNVARQLVVFQPNNTAPVTFTNNIVGGVTGGGISYNNAVTCDVPGSTVTGNTFEGEFGVNSFALRVRGINSVVSGNTNVTTTYNNVGYYILPNWANGFNITAGTMIANSSKYWLCTQTHLSEAANAPTGVDGALYWSEITVDDVMASADYSLGEKNVGSNTSLADLLVTLSQISAGSPIVVSFNKNMLKQVSAVSSDPEFSSEANWNIVGVVYKKESKRLVSGFVSDFTQERSMKLRSGVSGESFSLHKIIISKADRTLKVVGRAQIENASSMDVTLK